MPYWAAKTTKWPPKVRRNCKRENTLSLAISREFYKGITCFRGPFLRK